jgi:hypothetical protein
MHRCCCPLLLVAILVVSPLHAQAKPENRTERARHAQAELRESLTPLMTRGAQDSARVLYLSAMSDALRIAYAETAAPYELASRATILDPMSGDTLRQGSDGWTCLPMPGSPMCLDEPWMAWFDAIRSGADSLDIDEIGIGYMMMGDQGGPNTSVADAADGPTADNDWVIAGPHLMIVAPDSSLLSHFPTDPEAGGPFVMWRGTGLAHVMIPIYEGSMTMPYRHAAIEPTGTE